MTGDGKLIDYDELAGTYSHHRDCWPNVVTALITRARIGPLSRVLEVGCGTGNYLIALRRATGAACRGVDPSREMMAVASRRSDGVELGLGHAEQLPFHDAEFDFVFSVDVVHHVTDPPAYLREAYRVLKVGGRLCTVTDDETTIRSRAHAVYFPETVETELQRYPRIPQLQGVMADIGFREISEQRTELPYEITDLEAFRLKAFSSLHLIPSEAFARGLRRMTQDIARGPIAAVSRQVLLWGTKTAT